MGIAGIAHMESGKVYHLLRCTTSIEFYRCGLAHCGLVFDEEKDAVEIFPGDYTYFEFPVCKKCQQEHKRRLELELPLVGSQEIISTPNVN